MLCFEICSLLNYKSNLKLSKTKTGPNLQSGIFIVGYIDLENYLKKLF